MQTSSGQQNMTKAHGIQSQWKSSWLSLASILRWASRHFHRWMTIGPLIQSSVHGSVQSCCATTFEKSCNMSTLLLWKVRPLLDVLYKNCMETYAPHRQLSIDENMIGTKCWLTVSELAYALTTEALALRRSPGCPPSQALSRLSGKHHLYLCNELAVDFMNTLSIMNTSQQRTLWG